MFEEFKRDFIDNPFKIDGLNIKIVLKNSSIPGFETYPETFVHLITRKVESRQRMFDRHRANRIHWIRCILENRNEEEIIFFQYPEDSGRLRDYYWYRDEDFLVIMEKILPDYLVITSFHIDSELNRKYFKKRLDWFRANRT
ncbi:hypothetical protein FXO21_21855 [Dyadobacter sp. UC 10]|nr:hypothetical protein FXO21_21855 [Dyadobacter sp. UC 10]